MVSSEEVDERESQQQRILNTAYIVGDPKAYLMGDPKAYLVADPPGSEQ